MRPIQLSILCAIILCAAPAFAAQEAPPAQAPQRPVLVIFNLKCDDVENNDVGQRVSIRLRGELRAGKRLLVPDELDFDEMENASVPRPGLEERAAAERLAAPFGARFVVWGEVTKEGVYTATVRAADLSGAIQTKDFETSGRDLGRIFRNCGELAGELAKHLTGADYRDSYPSKSTEGYKRVSANLVANGDFEKGGGTPDNWERVDGLCSFWGTDAERGRFIRMDTDVYLSEWLNWRKRFDAGERGPAPAKTVTAGKKYDTVAGTYGVHLYSDMIPVKPGATYAIEFDAKSPSADEFFFPKVFVKGYGGEGVTKEHYNMYKAVHAGTPGEWEHFSRIFHPTQRTPQVANMRVMLFAYWPPGEYAFDNVAVYEVEPAE